MESARDRPRPQRQDRLGGRASNRPVVIKHGDLYRMWYTGQARGKSWIGYATSEETEKITKHRESDKPVLSADEPWEGGGDVP